MMSGNKENFRREGLRSLASFEKHLQLSNYERLRVAIHVKVLEASRI